jgi:hypothetical protein
MYVLVIVRTCGITNGVVVNQNNHSVQSATNHEANQDNHTLADMMN